MKIQKVTTENRAKVYALLRKAFRNSDYEAELVRQLHENGKPLLDWVCIHTGKAIAYIAFSNAYRDGEVCGLHLAPMAVAPDFQKQGIGTELMNFALRQAAIKEQALFVLGKPEYYRRFGFTPCEQPVCPFDKNNAHFLSLRNEGTEPFTVGYEPEFYTATAAPAAAPPKRRR